MKNEFEMVVNAFVMQSTTGVIPGTNLPSRVKRSRLANCNVDKPLIPDMIFTAEFEHIFLGDKRKIADNISAYKTKLDDVVIGAAKLKPADRRHINSLNGKQRISFENLIGRDPQLGFEEMPDECETDHAYVVDYFNRTTTRELCGKYVIRIPFKTHAELVQCASYLK